MRCELAFACDVAWSSMTPTAQADVRHCGRCERDVFEVRSVAAFAERARQGDCVAIAPELLSPAPPGARPADDLGPAPPLAGMPMPPRYEVPVEPEAPTRPWWRRIFGGGERR